MNKFNINDCIYIKLTYVGRKEIERQHNELYKDVSLIPPCYMKPEDKDGWSKWQMHEVMFHFGHMLIPHSAITNLPFETTIRFERDD